MHRLNGRVSTPLFNHLGSSSWHSYDAAMIVRLGKGGGWGMPVVVAVLVAVAFVGMRRMKRARGRGPGF